MSHRLDLPATSAAPAAALCAALLAAGCRPPGEVRPGDIRTYSVARTAAPVVAPVVAPAAAAPRAPAVRYEVPAGWSDRGAAGMRLATLAIGDPADGRDVTVIRAAGTLRGNVDRWQGQLDAASAAEDRAAAVDRALAAAETVVVDGTPATIVALFDAAAAAEPDAAGEAILAAMIPVDDASALFVKFKGDAAVARRERDAFVRFVSSLRWK
ncbi:MAG: hypothetical protein ACKON7_05210 [Planctomycetaceae bacterium]